MSKYNFIHEIPNYDFRPFGKLILVIDWLTLNINDVFCQMEFDNDEMFELSTKSDNYQFLKIDQKTTNFNKMVKIFKNGVQVAVTVYDSNKTTILKNRAHLKFENYLFYSNEWIQILNDLIENLNINSITISRIDVACDGINLNNFIYDWTNNKISTNALFRVRDNDNICINNVRRSTLGNEYFDSFIIGQIGSKMKETSRSTKFFRYYNKTKEISDNDNSKQYINEFHHENGLTGKDVHRFEVSLTSDYLNRKMINIFWLIQNLSKNLEKLFVTALENSFEFRYNDDSNPTRCTPYKIFEGFDTATTIKTTKKEKDKTRTIKVSIKRLYHEIMIGKLSSEKQKDDREMLLLTLVELIRLYSLQDWIYNAIEHWHKEFRQLERIQNKKVNWEYMEILIENTKEYEQQ